MGRPLISVVMPIYNVEAHLRQAIHSVLEQTISDFELILVDDCSPDGCPAICDAYAEKYDKITVIHHDVNQGLSAARNTGMRAASGRYIWFMDSDDTVDTNLFQKVYDSIQKNPAQIIVFGLVEEYFDQDDSLHHTEVICPEEHYFSNKEDLRRYVIDLEVSTLYGYAWNKFYSLDYLRTIGLQYEKVTLIEDILFNVQFCMEIESMNVLAITPYHYKKRMDNSLTSKFVAEYYPLHRRRIAMIFEQYCKWNLCNENVKKELAALFTRYIFSAIQRNCDKRSNMTHRDRKKWMNAVFHEELFMQIIPYGDPDSIVLKIMIFCLKKQNVALCLALGRLIYLVKNKMPMIFARVKQSRA